MHQLDDQYISHTRIASAFLSAPVMASFRDVVRRTRVRFLSHTHERGANDGTCLKFVGWVGVRGHFSPGLAHMGWPLAVAFGSKISGATNNINIILFIL